MRPLFLLWRIENMAYQATKHKRVTEELELVDDNGVVQHTIVVDLDASTMVKQLSEKQLALVHAQKEFANIQATGGDAMETLNTVGAVATDLFQAVFGIENYNVIAAFYGDKVVEMCQEILPFVINVIIPKVREVAQDSKKQMLNGYKSKGLKR